MKETEQTLLEKIRDDVAREFGYSAYRDFVNGMDDRGIIDEIANRYATAKAQSSCEATLKNVSEKAKVMREKVVVQGGKQLGKFINSEHFWSTEYEFYQVDKSSILDPSNITIV